jgi:hypothetical protein
MLAQEALSLTAQVDALGVPVHWLVLESYQQPSVAQVVPWLAQGVGVP